MVSFVHDCSKNRGLNHMKKPYVVPNVITALGLSIGLFVIFKATLYDATLEPKILLLRSSLLIMAAACIDVLDGFVARRLKGESLFGMNFDSLSDAITFGVAPAVLLMKTAQVAPKTLPYFFTFWGAMLFSLSGVLRLVRFNVQTLGVEKPENHKIYTGLPIPAAAMAALSMQLFFCNSSVLELFGSVVLSYIAPFFMILLAYAMISLKRFVSLKWIQKEHLDFFGIFIISLIMLTLLFGFMYHFDWFFFLVTWAYVMWGIFYRSTNQSLETLEE